MTNGGMSRHPSAAESASGSRPPSAVELKAVIAAERDGRPFALWRGPDGVQRILALDSVGWRVTIGRDPGADISLVWDREVSRTHALLERVGSGWTLVDDGLSRHGSYLNQARVVGRGRLIDRDRMRFGSTEVTFRDPLAARGESTSAVSTHAPVLSLSPMQRKVLIALCRPVYESESAIPATNRQVADEVYLSVNAVKAHLRVLFDRYGLEGLPQNEKRSRLAAAVLVSGALSHRDFEPPRSSIG